MEDFPLLILKDPSEFQIPALRKFNLGKVELTYCSPGLCSPVKSSLCVQVYFELITWNLEKQTGSRINGAPFLTRTYWNLTLRESCQFAPGGFRNFICIHRKGVILAYGGEVLSNWSVARFISHYFSRLVLSTVKLRSLDVFPLVSHLNAFVTARWGIIYSAKQF